MGKHKITVEAMEEVTMEKTIACHYSPTTQEGKSLTCIHHLNDGSTTFILKLGKKIKEYNSMTTAIRAYNKI